MIKAWTRFFVCCLLLAACCLLLLAEPVRAATGLVAAYALDAGSGAVAADASGAGNAGTILNGTWTTSGKYGAAITFNGTSSRIQVADAPSLDLTDALTLMAWVYPTAGGAGWRTVVIKEQPAQLAYALYARNGSGVPSCHVWVGGDRELAGPSALPLNAWSHLACTYDGAMQRLYVNGIEAASRAQIGAVLAATGPLEFGGNGIWPEWFAGRLDEIRIYNRPLSAAEVAADMTTPITMAGAPPPAPVLNPIGLSAAVELAWIDQSSNEETFEVEQSLDGAAAFARMQTLPADTETFAVAGLQFSRTYCWRVRAVNAAGPSDYSNTACARVTDAGIEGVTP